MTAFSFDSETADLYSLTLSAMVDLWTSAFLHDYPPALQLSPSA